MHEALDILAREHPVQAEVVKLRYFGGHTNDEALRFLTSQFLPSKTTGLSRAPGFSRKLRAFRASLDQSIENSLPGWYHLFTAKAWDARPENFSV